jgi:3-oxoacyl-[acyl-carrier-protein] synthase II
VQLAGEVKEEILLPPEVMRIAAYDPKVGFAYAACAEALACAGIERLDSETLLHLGASLEIFHPEKIVCKGEPDFAKIVQQNLSRDESPLQVPLDTATRLICDLFGNPAEALTNCSACAASAQAIGHGFMSIRSGKFSVAVCGGFDSMINPLGIGGFQLLGALTTDNERGKSACRPFDASRSGTVLGEGAGVAVLEPLEKAVAEGKRIFAEVCGYGSTLDAYSLSAPDPQGDGAARAMRAALRDAGIEPDRIAYINTHGTGTYLNDEIEAQAIRRVFEGLWENIPVSSTKSVTGHLIAAAGAVELGACLLPLLEGAMPANPWLRKVGRGCELAHIVGDAAPFSGEYVLTNSFGFGGQNATLILRRFDGRR